MRDTILANVGCLAVFQVAGSDARQLVWELGKDHVSEDDVVSLDVHHCYVRATVGTERMPPFSMMVRKPEPGSLAVAQRIRDGASAYLTPETEIAAQQERGRQRIQEWRREVERIRQSPDPAAETGARAKRSKNLGRDGQRSKHFQPPTGGAEAGSSLTKRRNRRSDTEAETEGGGLSRVSPNAH